VRMKRIAAANRAFNAMVEPSWIRPSRHDAMKPKMIALTGNFHVSFTRLRGEVKGSPRCRAMVHQIVPVGYRTQGLRGD
jgi:hypothetical protein